MASASTSSAPVVIPGLSTKKISNPGNSHKLLRRPRAPVVLPALPSKHHENEEEDESSKKNSGYGSVIKMFQNSFELEALQGIVPDSEMPSGRGSFDGSLTSPPPPSVSDPINEEFNEVVYRENKNKVHVNVLKDFAATPMSGASFVSRDDLVYVLDPLFRDRTSLGTYVDGKSLVKPFKARGPDPLPNRIPRRPQEIILTYDADDQRFFEPPAFTLEHFIYKIAERTSLSVPRVRKQVYSKHNVKKLTDILSMELSLTGQENINLVNMDPSGIPVKENRIPQRQLLYEMAAMIKQHVREVMNTEVKSVIKPMPKFSPAYTVGSQPHTEIILYEDDTAEKSRSSTRKRQESEAPGTDAVLHSARSRYFQGSGRSRSPFAIPEDGAISPSELAILDSLINGGTALSLKAHFIEELPDISPLTKTLTYLNLCFNNFSNFPLEVLYLSNLEVLKLRNNPLGELPKDIIRLQKLKVLIVSFCLLTAVPISLFDLPCLKDLSVGYNRLTFLPAEIANCQTLQVLDIEGNQIPALPCSVVTMEHLQHVNLRNNMMHPLFWAENSCNKPQHLLDLACVVVRRSNHHKDPQLLSNETIRALSRMETCDCCKGPRFGPGLRVIRPMPTLFKVKNVPLMFRVCTPSCLKAFKEMSGHNLRIILYGE